MLKRLTGKIAIVSLLLTIPFTLGDNVYAAQMDVEIISDFENITPSYKFLRIVSIDYPIDSQLSELLQGKNKEISFTAGSSTLGIENLIGKINSNLLFQSSTGIVTDVVLNYNVILVGGENSAKIEYNIEMIPTISNLVLRQESEELSGILDAAWRGITVLGPVPINTQKYVQYDINSPKSALMVLTPHVYEKIEKTEAASVLDVPLIDASGIHELSLSKWHSLFDPTAKIASVEIFGYKETSVISHFSMGECNIEVGICEDKEWRRDFQIPGDDSRYIIRAIESQDDATISIAGYVRYAKIAGVEAFGLNSEGPKEATPPLDFPVSIIYWMAGIAAVGAVAIFLLSNRKLKKDKDMSQTGIDPAFLRVEATSLGAGGYRTNRGESYLRENLEYENKMPI